MFELKLIIFYFYAVWIRRMTLLGMCSDRSRGFWSKDGVTYVCDIKYSWKLIKISDFVFGKSFKS